MKLKYRPIPSQSILHSLLEYNPITGGFARKITSGRNDRWKAGTTAGSLSKDGYINISIGGVIFRAHRLAWVYMTGEQPTEHLDHKNHNTADNSWANLRQATPTQSSENRRVQKNNKLGAKGVHALKNGRYRVRVNRVHIGCYPSAEIAKAAYDAAAKVMHKGFFCP